MNYRFITLLVLIFLLGWLTKGVYSSVSDDFSYFEWNSDTNTTSEHPYNGIVGSFTEAKLKERPSPQERIKEGDIHVYENKVILDVNNPEWSTFTDTNSMDPVIDSGSYAIHIVPKEESEIKVGDIVAYQSEYADGTLIHRVIEVGEDEDGTYFIMKGDNNPQPDPGRVRFSQIKRVLVAIIY